MHILVVGAQGMIGRKLAASLMEAAPPGLVRLTLADRVTEDPIPENSDLEVMAVPLDITDPDAVDALIDGRPDVIFHLAAVVSGEAEEDFEKGYAVNFDGTRAFLEAIRRREGYHPRFVFASSIAVFGAPFPDPIPDEFNTTPLTSYGTQKAMAELLVSDYSRRGFLDGISLRLPTICIRPGKPNKAASGFFSGILREPLAGKEAILPVSDEVRHWHASPRAAVGFLRHAMALDTKLLGNRRAVTMPGLSATVAEQIEALQRIAGEGASGLIRRRPDQAISTIVDGWPTRFDPIRALGLGFVADDSFDAIIAAYLEDEGSGPTGN